MQRRYRTEHTNKKMHPTEMIGVFCYAVLPLLLSFGSVCGDRPVINSGKQLEHERMNGRSRREGEVGDEAWPGQAAAAAEAAAPVCTDDEYYDVNVQACSRCSDVCRPNIDLTFCASKCLEYFRVHFDPSIHPKMHQSSFAVIVISSPHGPMEERLTEKPLFWTSIVSMTIAVAATAAIIVLCIRRRKPRRGLVERMESNENSRARTLSETSDDRDPENRTLLHNSSRESARTTNCRELERGRGDFDESIGRSMFTTGGGRLGGQQTTTATTMVDRFGSGGGGEGGGGGGVCSHKSELSFLPVTPGLDHDRCPAMPQNWSHQRYCLNSNHMQDINSTTVSRDPDDDDIWTQQKPSPIFSRSEFMDNKRQLGPLTTNLSTSSTPYAQETSCASSIYEVDQAKEKDNSYFGEEDETCVKRNVAINSQGPPLLPRQADFTLESKAMGIQMNNGKLLGDIRSLRVSIRMATEDVCNPDYCPKAKTTLYSSTSAYDDGIATGPDEPN